MIAKFVQTAQISQKYKLLPQYIALNFRFKEKISGHSLQMSAI